MYRHKERVYKLGTALSIFGFQLSDLGILFAVWTVTFQGLTSGMEPRLRLLTTVIVVFIFSRLWISVRDKLPDKFFLHLLNWISEADIYRIAPDRFNLPLVVNPKDS